jgi:hypothetical protein
VHTYPAPPETQGRGIDLDPTVPGKKGAEYFKLDNADGTVPVSSGRALIDANPSVDANNKTVRDDKGKLVSTNIAKIEHSDFFGDSSVQQFTTMAIRQLDRKYRFLKIGR